MLLKHLPRYTVVVNVTLTPKQQIFAEEYIISGNATQAAIKEICLYNVLCFLVSFPCSYVAITRFLRSSDGAML